MSHLISSLMNYLFDFLLYTSSSLVTYASLVSVIVSGLLPWAPLNLVLIEAYNLLVLVSISTKWIYFLHLVYHQHLLLYMLWFASGLQFICTATYVSFYFDNKALSTFVFVYGLGLSAFKCNCESTYVLSGFRDNASSILG